MIFYHFRQGPGFQTPMRAVIFKSLFVMSLAIGLAGLTACKTVEPIPGDTTAGKYKYKANGKKPKVALVLGGGAARGFAHIGVIRVLEQEKIPIDIIVGTSVGSLIGALYADKKDSFELEWAAFGLQRSDLLDYTLLSASMGPVKGKSLEKFVNKNIATKRIEQLKIPFVAVATDLNRGERIVLDKGLLAPSIRASCSIPGVFQPVNMNGRLLVDGGVVDNLPIAVAREKGADVVIAVDISENITNYKISDVVDVTLQAINIMFEKNVAMKRKDADILLTPDVRNVGLMDFNHKKRLMQAGMTAARKAMPEIKAFIGEQHLVSSAE